jgi:cell division septum initiation protein DivIVA
MPRLRLIAPFVLVLSALLLVACGGDTEEKNDYVDEVNEIQTTLQDEINSLAEQPESPDQLVGFYDDAVASLNAAVTSLEDVSPPDDVTELHDRLISEVQELSDIIKGAADEIKNGGVAAVPGAVQQLVTEATRVQTEFSATIDEINSTLQD